MSDRIKAESDYEDDPQCDEPESPVANGKRTRQGGKTGGYLLQNVLKLPRATTYSTQALYDQIHAGDINLSPEYQRDVVWPDTKQIGLIDSILRNFYIPPVIFVAHQHEDGSETKTCIDGKQRLTSIQRFMDGAIPHKDPQAGDKYYYKTSAASNSRTMLLPDNYKRMFSNKQIVCIEYQELPESEEREIFQRVQLGMALTPAEKLQVISAPMASFIRTLQSKYFEAESPLGGDELDWDRSRGGDFRCITQASYIISRYPQQVSIGSIAQLEKWLHDPSGRQTRKGKAKAKTTSTDTDDGNDGQDDGLLKDKLAKIDTTFKSFSQLVADEKLRSYFLKEEWRVSPIEFVMMCLLISVEKDRVSLEEIAEKICAMRMVTRTEHVDIRMNQRVAKTMFDFIGKDAGPRTSTRGSANGTKRKRGDTGDDDDQGSSKGRKILEETCATSSGVNSRVPTPRPTTSTSLPSTSSNPSPAVHQTTPPPPTSVIIPPPRPSQMDKSQSGHDSRSSVAPANTDAAGEDDMQLSS